LGGGGSRPLPSAKASREKVVLISGVTVDGELYSDKFDRDMTGTEVIWFLERLLEEIPG
jgi:hypothetical protein